jgi:hypothetical protein
MKLSSFTQSTQAKLLVFPVSVGLACLRLLAGVVGLYLQKQQKSQGGTGEKIFLTMEEQSCCRLRFRSHFHSGTECAIRDPNRPWERGLIQEVAR